MRGAPLEISALHPLSARFYANFEIRAFSLIFRYLSFPYRRSFIDEIVLTTALTMLSIFGPLTGEVLKIHALQYFRLLVQPYVCSLNFLDSVHYFFSKILHRHGNLETKKS